MAGLRGWPSFPEELPEFDPGQAPATPQELFESWLFEAGEHVLAPHAVTLSTVDADGLPDARVVILKDVDATGWYVSTSADSPKAVQLRENPHAALTFFWPGRGRQVRLRGPVTTAAPEVSASDFSDRSPASKAESLIGHQSEVLENPADLLRAAEAAERQVRENPDVVPDSWTRYRVSPTAVEFWQASNDRRHVRLRYRRTGETWLPEHLWP
ncbi:MAG: pyridoxamine 5-phosphate oxidase [Amycolatopsis sp.]|jgi:pyridoxamine 5'-phosphate oxidase|uniref:pyridoxine/pyridoxamine 5'-phosphate oxidase n=1 Tax=Amycolatopsis sp. TaxID=37632 RepID=UPI002601A5A2|nr:pyridoxal 5'-phosphate synthase [Amycolatopsis sp.]MCU1685669.1 pyridoxamine 5-phosphate oxidase [Amycolatopsis sp.]